MDAFDLVIVGAGNAALSAAISAKENGAKNILVLEKASKKIAVVIAGTLMELTDLPIKVFQI